MDARHMTTRQKRLVKDRSIGSDKKKKLSAAYRSCAQETANWHEPSSEQTEDHDLSHGQRGYRENPIFCNLSDIRSLLTDRSGTHSVVGANSRSFLTRSARQAAQVSATSFAFTPN